MLNGTCSSSTDTTTWRAAASPPWENSWTFPGCWVIYHTAALSDLEGWWQSRQRQMGELESSCLSVMFSGHIYKALYTFLASSMVSQTPKAGCCTPHASKESRMHTCQPRPPAQLHLSLPPPFISCFYVVVVNMPPNFSCRVFLIFLTDITVLSPQITH